MGLGEEDHRGKVPLSTHHIKKTRYQYDLSLMTLTLITSLRRGSAGGVQVPAFSTVKLLLKLLRGIIFILQGSLWLLFGNGAEPRAQRTGARTSAVAESVVRSSWVLHP